MTYAAKCTSSAFHIRRRAARDFKRAYVSISFSETYFDRETAKDASLQKKKIPHLKQPQQLKKTIQKPETCAVQNQQVLSRIVRFNFRSFFSRNITGCQANPLLLKFQPKHFSHVPIYLKLQKWFHILT